MINVTAGELKEAIQNLPDDYEVYTERVEDVYYETHGWDKGVEIVKEGFLGEPEEFMTDHQFSSASAVTVDHDRKKVFIWLHY